MVGSRAVALVLALLPAAAAVAVGCASTDAEGRWGSGGGGGSATTSSSTSSTSSPSQTGAVHLGLPCTDDAACGEEGICLLPTATITPFASFWGLDQAGGPAGGYCSLSCRYDADCPGPGSRCLGEQPNGRCALGCDFALPALEQLDQDLSADKCQGRDDLACSPVAGGGALCMPVCGADSQCPANRHCDHRIGLCVDAEREGDPLGTACTPDDEATPQDEDRCAGFCQGLSGAVGGPEVHLCTARCSLGGPLASTTDCGGVASGLCLYRLRFEGQASELGDLGLCSKACQAHDQCRHVQGIFCFDFGTIASFGTGYCAGATPCPAGDECGEDEICVESDFGPVCLDESPSLPGQPWLPLGEAAPGGSGGGGGAGGSGGSGG